MASEEIKYFEVRDEGTLIPVLAVRVYPEKHAVTRNDKILRRGGFHGPHPVTFVTNLNEVEIQHDPWKWGGGRTLREAHLDIIVRWDKLRSGQVIDVQFVLSETTAPKETGL